MEMKSGEKTDFCMLYGGGIRGAAVACSVQGAKIGG